MSREHKYRVYSFLDKCFHYFTIYEGVPQGIAGGLSEPQQYTGLTDSKGKEIYEGDILLEYIANETQTKLGICKEILGGWKIFAYPDSSICWHGWKQEVIGNIFENPELLK